MAGNPLLLGILCTLCLLSACAQGDNPALLGSGNPDTIDMLTPEYYSSPAGSAFQTQLDEFVDAATLVSFQHPLDDGTGMIPAHSIPLVGEWGAGKGPGGNQEHHPAVDLHVGNNQTLVNIYADHDGVVTTGKSSPKYRHYLTISKEIKDGGGATIGWLVTLYGHLDLDLDEAGGLNLNGQTVAKGDLVSRHLYSGTAGGPHLHYEIRYYRPADSGSEEYYGWSGGSPNFTSPSVSPWIYGYWDPTIGYGFGNPRKFLGNDL